MAVRCEGDPCITEQLGEKQDFEAQLTRLGFRHEDFALYVRRASVYGTGKAWTKHYAVRVTNTVSGKRNIYWGGPGENWVAQFAVDLGSGLYSEPPVSHRQRGPRRYVA